MRRSSQPEHLVPVAAPAATRALVTIIDHNHGNQQTHFTLPYDQRDAMAVRDNILNRVVQGNANSVENSHPNCTHTITIIRPGADSIELHLNWTSRNNPVALIMNLDGIAIASDLDVFAMTHPDFFAELNDIANEHQEHLEYILARVELDVAAAPAEMEEEDDALKGEDPDDGEEEEEEDDIFLTDISGVGTDLAFIAAQQYARQHSEAPAPSRAIQPPRVRREANAEPAAAAALREQINALRVLIAKAEDIPRRHELLRDEYELVNQLFRLLIDSKLQEFAHRYRVQDRESSTRFTDDPLSLRGRTASPSSHPHRGRSLSPTRRASGIPRTLHMDDIDVRRTDRLGSVVNKLSAQTMVTTSMLGLTNQLFARTTKSVMRSHENIARIAAVSKRVFIDSVVEKLFDWYFREQSRILQDNQDQHQNSSLKWWQVILTVGITSTMCGLGSWASAYCVGECAANSTGILHTSPLFNLCLTNSLTFPYGAAGAIGSYRSSQFFNHRTISKKHWRALVKLEHSWNHLLLNIFNNRTNRIKNSTLRSILSDSMLIPRDKQEIANLAILLKRSLCFVTAGPFPNRNTPYRPDDVRVPAAARPDNADPASHHSYRICDGDNNNNMIRAISGRWQLMDIAAIDAAAAGAAGHPYNQAFERLATESADFCTGTTACNFTKFLFADVGFFMRNDPSAPFDNDPHVTEALPDAEPADLMASLQDAEAQLVGIRRENEKKRARKPADSHPVVEERDKDDTSSSEASERDPLLG